MTATRGLAAVLVITGAVLVGCDDTADSGDLAEELTRENATALVADGTSPTGDDVGGMPDDTAGRIGWLLTAVDWDGASAQEIAVGLTNATDADPGLVAELVRGVSDADARVVPALRDAVGEVLRSQSESVRAALADAEPRGDVRLDRAALLDTFASIGFGHTAGMEDDLRDGMRAGMLRDLPIPVPDGPAAVRAWERAYPGAYRRWAEPLVVMYAASARSECDDEDACRALVGEEVGTTTRVFAGVVDGRIPLALLPGRLAEVLATEPDGGRTGLVDEELAEVWDDFRLREGYDLTELVLAEIGSR